MSLLDLDINGAKRVAFERNKICVYNNLLTQYFPIGSNVTIEIHTYPDIAKFNPDFEKNAIYVVLRNDTEQLCRQIQSNMYFPRGKKCEPNSEPIVFQSGYSGIDACQPNTFGGHAPKTADMSFPSSFWSPRCNSCQMTINLVSQWAFDDYSRSDTHPARGVDNIGTGFTLDPNPRQIPSLNAGDELNDVLNWRLDWNYCRRFLLNFNASKMECERTWAEKVTGFFVGDEVFVLMTWGVMSLAAGIGTNDYMPPVPVKLKKPFTKKEFEDGGDLTRFCIDPKVTPEQLGLRSPNVPAGSFWRNGVIIVPQIALTKSGLNANDLPAENCKVVDFEAQRLAQERDKVPRHLRINDWGMRATDEYEVLGIRPQNINLNDTEADLNVDSVMDTLLQLAKDLGIQVSVDMILMPLLKKIFKQLVEQKVAKMFTKKILVHVAIRFMAKLPGMVLKLLDVPGWILLALDLLLSFLDLDLLGRSKVIGQINVDAFGNFVPHAMLQNFGVSSMEMSPILIFLLLENLLRDELQLTDDSEETPLKVNIRNVLAHDAAIFNPNKVYGIMPELVKWYRDIGEETALLWMAMRQLNSNAIGERINWSKYDSLTTADLDKFNSDCDKFVSTYPQSRINQATFISQMRRNIETPLVYVTIILAIIICGIPLCQIFLTELNHFAILWVGSLMGIIMSLFGIWLVFPS